LPKYKNHISHDLKSKSIKANFKLLHISWQESVADDGSNLLFPMEFAPNHDNSRVYGV
jgi:hypothetical protein